MSHDAGRTCICRSPHAPEPLELERHHIWPTYLGGPDVVDNLVWVCPTTHTNIHEILRLILRVGSLPWGEVAKLYDIPVSRYAYNLATEGYRRYIQRTVT